MSQSDHIVRTLDSDADERKLARWCNHENVHIQHAETGKITAVRVWTSVRSGAELPPPEPGQFWLDQMARHHFHVVRPDGRRRRVVGFQEACLALKLARINDERSSEREGRWF